MWRATGLLIYTSSVGAPYVDASILELILSGYPSKSDLVIFNDIIKEFEKDAGNEMDIHSLLYSDLGAQLPLHISLSRPVVLRTEQRHSFAETFEKEIRDSHIQP